MANILMVNHALGFGGSPISMLELAVGLRERGHCVITAAGADGPLRERYEALGFQVRILPRRGPMSLGLILDYYRLIRAENIELLHLNTLTSYFKYPAAAGRLTGIPVVWWSREDVSEKRCQRLLPWMKRFASHAVTVSHEQTIHMPGILPDDHVHVFYKGIHPAENIVHPADDDFPDNPGWQPPLIGYMGALEERKGLHDLVEAMALLKAEGIHGTILVVGKDASSDQKYLSKIQDRIRELKLEDQFIFLGTLHNARELYHRVDLFVLPTYWDCCARVLTEAMEAKCPIVTTNAGGTPEMLQNGKDAFLVSPADPEALAIAINKTLSDPQGAARRAESGHQVFRNRFLFDYHLSEVDSLYGKLIEQ